MVSDGGRITTWVCSHPEYVFYRLVCNVRRNDLAALAVHIAKATATGRRHHIRAGMDCWINRYGHLSAYLIEYFQAALERSVLCAGLSRLEKFPSSEDRRARRFDDLS